MKVSYKYVWKGHTVVSLDENVRRYVKVQEWQIIESDRDPKYFLTAWFVLTGGLKKSDLGYVKKAIKVNKMTDELKTQKDVSKSTKVNLEVKGMSLKEIKDKLNELGVKFKHNTGKKKLEEKLIMAMMIE